MKMVPGGLLFRTSSTASTAPFGTKFDSLAGAHVALRGGGCYTSRSDVYLFIRMTKPIDWRGSALDDVRAFPEDAKKVAGFQLRKVQQGANPDEFKQMPEIGAGVNEVIVDTADGWFRVMYVAKFEEAVYVLHSFQKKTNKTSQSDKDIAKRRYKAVVEERKAK